MYRKAIYLSIHFFSVDHPANGTLLIIVVIVVLVDVVVIIVLTVVLVAVPAVNYIKRRKRYNIIIQISEMDSYSLLHASEPPSISRTSSPSICQSDSNWYVAYLLCACWKVSDQRLYCGNEIVHYCCSFV